MPRWLWSPYIHTHTHISAVRESLRARRDRTCAACSASLQEAFRWHLVCQESVAGSLMESGHTLLLMMKRREPPTGGELQVQASGPSHLATVVNLTIWVMALSVIKVIRVTMAQGVFVWQYFPLKPVHQLSAPIYQNIKHVSMYGLFRNMA